MQDPIPFEGYYEFAEAPSSDQPNKTAFYAFDTEVTVQAFGSGAKIAEAFSIVRDECRRYERLFSRTLPHSDVSALNSAKGSWINVAEDTYDLLRKSTEYCEKSNGLFDITIGSVSRLWDFRRGIRPSDASLSEALLHVDYRNLELGGQRGCRAARLADPLACIDLGGIAKGYIADRLCDLLEDMNVSNFLLNLGGNIAARGGKPDGSPFCIGVRNPKLEGHILKKLPLENGSVVTSGMDQRSFVEDGVRYCHILSAKTGKPFATDVESVTVVGAKSLDCEGFSTTLCALGIEKGIAFAEDLHEISRTLFVDSKNHIYESREQCRPTSSPVLL